MRFRVSRPHKHPKSSIPWFRIAVPKDLRAKIGQSEIKQSLGTTDPNEAQIQLARLTAEWKSRFQALRNEAATEDLARSPELVDEFLRQLADRRHGDLDGAIYALQKLIAVRTLTAWGPSEYYGRGANRALGHDPDPSMWADWETDPDPLADLIPEDDRDGLIERVAHLNRNAETLGFGFHEILRYIQDRKRWSAVDLEVLMIEQFTITSIAFGSAMYDAVAEHLVRRLCDYRSSRWNLELLSALQLAPGFALQAPITMAPMMPPVVAASSAHVNTIGQQVISNLGKNQNGMQSLSEGLQRWKELKKPGPSAKVEADRAVGRFVELFGDKPVSLITDDELYDYRDFISKMPANLSLPAIQKSGLDLRTAVDRALEEKPDRELLSPGSIKKDIGALSAIFTALREERWIKTNVAAGISVAGYSKKRRGQKNPRLPLRPAQMETLFASPLFTGCIGPRDFERTKPGPYVYQDELYWAFLFGATAGPRLEEVGQIRVDDIEVVERGDEAPIVGIYVTGTGESQSTKTDESIRVIIVHPRLVELGFLSFVSSRKEMGVTQLFDLKQSKLGSWSKELSRRANRYLDRAVVDDKRYVWYSMRHEFADRSELDLSEATSRQIMGHARGRLYGLGAPLHRAAKELEKLDLNFIDWDRLKVAAGRDDKA
ncbi:DUF6538 domain-containing protein [Sphingopyxis sp.]|uniref:DUF6538 domain-containing protein n=1 Tax=Sphingopyxis sp. TaxID=1908224 RepID=UPI002B497DF3|nr:DUF6538 domain-containing protein [Sphingopyxis sp.]HJS12206.1 DUF6538 domain-containing protein [Sphingopyxis sp.]